MNYSEPHMLYADSDYAVFYKPSGMPSAPLKKDDTHNALYEASKSYPSLMSVTSRYKDIEHGLLHRIDTSTSGLILFAGNQQSYDALLEQQDKNVFYKHYTAFVRQLNILENNNVKGFPPCTVPLVNVPVHITSSFRKFGPGGSEVRPVQPNTVSYYAKNKSVIQEYTTTLENLLPVEKVNNETVYKASCSIFKGFRHQVRCHLAWIGLPVIGDQVYSIENDTILPQGEKIMLFFADKLEFISPSTHKKVSYCIDNSFFDSISFTSASR